MHSNSIQIRFTVNRIADFTIDCNIANSFVVSLCESVQLRAFFQDKLFADNIWEVCEDFETFQYSIFAGYCRVNLFLNPIIWIYFSWGFQNMNTIYCIKIN